MTRPTTSFPPPAQESAGSNGGTLLAGPPRTARVDPPRRRRQPALIAAGAALIVVCALAAVWMVGAVGDRVDVVSVVREVAFGQTIAREDLTVARISVDPAVRTVSWSDVDDVVGRTARTTLYPGSLLTPEVTTDDPAPGPGQQLIGVEVKTAQLPVGAVAPGDQVLLIVTIEQSQVDVVGVPPAPSADGVNAVVLTVGETSSRGTVNVNVIVDAADGSTVAAAAASGQLTIVLVAPDGGD